jgi:alanyl-tRNA synthetase
MDIKMLTLNSIRSKFVNYFVANKHQHLDSSSLVPHDDPSLMFTNAGMVQFKNIFTGNEKSEFDRIVTSQKCVRAGGKHNDLDNVGYTARHHTFFEMLGNFSFGNYFKEDAIFFAWDFLTNILAIPKDKLYITVYYNDDEAVNIWKKISGFNDDRIIRIESNDNFWSMGDEGPCGPSTEIFYDHGEHIWGGLPGTAEENGDRYVEIWNIVFMQYYQYKNGDRITLPKPSIDTGMGLERIAAILQNVHNNYEIDLFKNIIDDIAKIVKIAPTTKNIASFRVISDHLRSTSFLIADGVMPSNEGRGYVLRRIMRRAMRHINVLGYDGILLPQLVPSIIREMGDTYPELIRAEKLIEDVFMQEEEKFKSLLARGMKLLDEHLVNIKQGSVMSGKIAFKLYDTYGFPLDLTMDILKASNITVNEEEFHSEMEIQKQKAREAWSGSGEKITDTIWFDIVEKHGVTEFLGYKYTDISAKILAIEKYDDDHNMIITDKTTFYAESGGQVGDIGYIIDGLGNRFEVINTLKFLGKIHAHICKINQLEIGTEVTLQINQNYRKKIKANHSSVHLLHFALRKILGEHVVQKGSLVTDTRLRFDLSHSKPLSQEELQQIEQEVNALIRANFAVTTEQMDIKKAIESGAMALFGEKYDEEVRVVSIGNAVELCGGTHIEFTGSIGLFKIVTETSIAAGVRRIEAVTGEEALSVIQNIENTTNKLANIVKCSVSDLEIRVENLLNDKKQLESNIKKMQLDILLSEDNTGENIGKYTFIAKTIKDVSPNDIRLMIDQIRNKNEKNIVLAISNYQDKTSVILGLNKNNQELNAITLLKNSIEQIGGKGGGGKNDIAQAGGIDFAKTDQLINIFKNEIIKNSNE